MTSQTPNDVMVLIAGVDRDIVRNELVKLTFRNPDAYEKFVKVFQRGMKRKGGSRGR